ncbi:MAG TPA: Gfo/Idh/MocA family oxidoreductase [Pseudobdellovibrionaceae bacterium]|nr:Gfo/Idh/MocA family oxidoreductase [Pseudobdellovibrionaceae bacterium]
MSQDKKLKAAVVGVGYLGRFHAQKMKNHPLVELVGVSDMNPQNIEKVSAELSVSGYLRYQDLIGKVDAVTIAASTLAHYEIARFFLQNGVHVNVEKPITSKSTEAESLVQLAKEKNLVLTVGHVERFNPVILAAQKQRKPGPEFIELIRKGPFKERGADVNVLYDLMIHDIDLLLWLGQSEIQDIRGMGGVLVSKELDWCQVHITLKNGIQSLIQVSRVSPVSERRLHIHQGCQILVADTQNLKLEILSKSNQPGEFLSVSSIPFEKFDALQLETNAFVEAVQGVTPLKLTGQDGLNALKAIEWIERQIQKIQS